MSKKKKSANPEMRRMEVCHVVRHPDPERIGLVVFMAEPGYPWAPAQRGIDNHERQIRLRVNSVLATADQTEENGRLMRYRIDPTFGKLEDAPKALHQG